MEDNLIFLCDPANDAKIYTCTLPVIYDDDNLLGLAATVWITTHTYIYTFSK